VVKHLAEVEAIVAGVKVLQAQGMTDIPLSAAQRAARAPDNAPPLAPHGGDRRSTKKLVKKLKSKGPTNEYIAARINRDHPEIAARMRAGEFRSVRAAAIAAGIVKVPSALEVAQKAFRKLGPKERAAFLGTTTLHGGLEFVANPIPNLFRALTEASHEIIAYLAVILVARYPDPKFRGLFFGQCKPGEIIGGFVFSIEDAA
jgi:hypothetical protein